MRFYEITLTDPTNAEYRKVFTSWYNERNDPGALNIMFDAMVVPFATPANTITMEIWGVSLQTISQASDFNNKNIVVRGGFKPGLPLATVASRNQSGPLFQGFVLQAFGNWIGTDMTLNLIVSPGFSPSGAPPTGSETAPANIAWSMPSGMLLSTSIENAIKTAFPTFGVEVNIRNISVNRPIYGVFSTLSRFAQEIKRFSQASVGGTYAGVNFRLGFGNVVSVYDDVTTAKKVDISFQDLIGQPTWLEPQKIQLKCPLRADLQVGYEVKLPDGFYGVSPAQSNVPWNYRNRSAQRGTFNVNDVRHVGNFRQADASSWATIITCVYLPART